MSNKVHQTGTRPAYATKFVRWPHYTLLFVEANAPGCFYVIEEPDDPAKPDTRQSVRIRDADYILEQYGIDLRT